MLEMIFFIPVGIMFLVILDIKTITVHLCLASPIYWRWAAHGNRATMYDMVYTLAAGPVTLQVVRASGKPPASRPPVKLA